MVLVGFYLPLILGTDGFTNLTEPTKGFLYIRYLMFFSINPGFEIRLAGWQAADFQETSSSRRARGNNFLIFHNLYVLVPEIHFSYEFFRH